MTGLGFQSFFAVLVVLALVGALAWLVRRGAFGALRNGARAISIETAVPIGERLLLGLTPSQISMVTELGAAPTFEQQLNERAKGSVTPASAQPSSRGITPRTIFGGILQLNTNES